MRANHPVDHVLGDDDTPRVRRHTGMFEQNAQRAAVQILNDHMQLIICARVYGLDDIRKCTFHDDSIDT